VRKIDGVRPDGLRTSELRIGINIQSGRGTWPYDAAATCQGKVRTPRDGTNMATPEFPPRFCGLYLPGHEVHWIQGLKFSDLDHPRTEGALIDVGDDGIIVVEFDDGIRRFWNHEPLRLEHFAARVNNHVERQQRWGLLGIPAKRGWSIHCFCIASPDDHRSCPNEPPTGTAFELLESAGGFTMSTAELTAQLSEHGPQS
jgi:hypothetical protein